MRNEQNNFRKVNCIIGSPALLVQVIPQTALVITVYEVIFSRFSCFIFQDSLARHNPLTNTAKVYFRADCLDRLARWFDVYGLLCDISTVTG